MQKRGLGAFSVVMLIHEVICLEDDDDPISSCPDYSAVVPPPLSLIVLDADAGLEDVVVKQESTPSDEYSNDGDETFNESSKPGVPLFQFTEERGGINEKMSKPLHILPPHIPLSKQYVDEHWHSEQNATPSTTASSKMNSPGRRVTFDLREIGVSRKRRRVQRSESSNESSDSSIEFLHNELNRQSKDPPKTFGWLPEDPSQQKDPSFEPPRNLFAEDSTSSDMEAETLRVNSASNKRRQWAWPDINCFNYMSMDEIESFLYRWQDYKEAALETLTRKQAERELQESTVMFSSEAKQTWLRHVACAALPLSMRLWSVATEIELLPASPHPLEPELDRLVNIARVMPIPSIFNVPHYHGDGRKLMISRLVKWFPTQAFWWILRNVRPNSWRCYLKERFFPRKSTVPCPNCQAIILFRSIPPESEPNVFHLKCRACVQKHVCFFPAAAQSQGGFWLRYKSLAAIAEISNSFQLPPVTHLENTKLQHIRLLEQSPCALSMVILLLCWLPPGIEALIGKPAGRRWLRTTQCLHCGFGFRSVSRFNSLGVCVWCSTGTRLPYGNEEKFMADEDRFRDIAQEFTALQQLEWQPKSYRPSRNETSSHPRRANP
eukprot:Gregarina_sp_Poly_1__10180@NODE_6_length_24954_cov_45_443846_g5_i0_p2_GENE_NODE_6_length_24954_cov_45_443846_g5_i0NODE_6_length_24954_cov_45_443846_g5_i0_p2_ORF_typecomplete_len607_score83_07_NODE_6_length_24954_cov_45_443846_g5_i0882410644